MGSRTSSDRSPVSLPTSVPRGTLETPAGLQCLHPHQGEPTLEHPLELREGVAVHDGVDGDLDIRFTSDYHSANFVPIFATGPGAEVFDAFMDNTEIGRMLIEYIKK